LERAVSLAGIALTREDVDVDVPVHSSISYDIKPMGDLQRDRQLLLDQQDRDPAPDDLREERPNSPVAGFAHRAAGTTCWFAGEYREARDNLGTCALFQPGRDDLAFLDAHKNRAIAAQV
jgi:hypothetical protein